MEIAAPMLRSLAPGALSCLLLLLLGQGWDWTLGAVEPPGDLPVLGALAGALSLCLCGDWHEAEDRLGLLDEPCAFLFLPD